MSAYLSKDEVQTFLQRSKYFNKKFSKSTSTYYFQNTLDAMKLIYLQYFLPDKQTKQLSYYLIAKIGKGFLINSIVV